MFLAQLVVGFAVQQGVLGLSGGVAARGTGAALRGGVLMLPDENVVGLHMARSAARRGYRPPDDELLTRRQVCSRFGISETTLWRWQRLGLRSIKFGSARNSPVRFRASDVDRFVARFERQV